MFRVPIRVFSVVFVTCVVSEKTNSMMSNVNVDKSLSSHRASAGR